jgi:Domain of unknown function (DUF2019)
MSDLTTLSNQQLVDAYVELSRQQGAALLNEDTRKYNHLFDKVNAIYRELRKRGDDVRKAMLIPLLKRAPGESVIDYGTAQRRYNAAADLMGVAPDLAKPILEELANGALQDYCVRAGMDLLRYEKGAWKPR